MPITQLQIPGYATPQAIDWSPLANLGKVYEQAQAKRGLQEALAGGVDPNNPQSLSALAARVLPYDSTMGLSLAQLGNTAQNRQQDVSWRQQEAERTQQNADRSFGLQARSQTRLDETAEEASPAGRAKTAGSYGIQPNTPEFRSYVLTGKMPEANTTIAAQTTQRQQAAASLGLTPDNPGYQSFVLTGKMPREDAQPLTAGDKEAIRTADDMVMSNKAAIDSLARAKALSKQAMSGPYADKRGYAASFLGESSDIGKSGIATENLTNEVMTNSLGQMKAIFGSNPTEGERKVMLDLQGSVNKPDNVRQAIFDRGINVAQQRLEYNRQRADSLRGNTYYKNPNATPAVVTPNPAPQAAPQAAQQQGGITQEQYAALPSGTPYTAPDGTQRIKP